MSVLTDLVVSAGRALAPSGFRAITGAPYSMGQYALDLRDLGPFGFAMNYQFDREEIDSSFVSLIRQVYKRNGIVWAVELARLMLFSQARFVFRRWEGDEPQKPFTTGDLDILNLRPWEGGVTGDLLTRLLQSADFAGTGFVVYRSIGQPDLANPSRIVRQPELRVPRPDWMTMILGSYTDPAADSRDIDATLIGLLYHPGGRNSGIKPIPLLPSEVANFTLVPDPEFVYWGIPWLLPVIPNVQGHNAATEHKLRFFENGATPQVVVTLGDKANDPEKFRKWIELFNQEHNGAANAYRTMYLAAGASAEVVGANLQQLDFRKVQDVDELAIANAGNVPATIVGLSEGLQGSSLNAGNFGQTMRRFANLFARPAWQNVSGSLQRIVVPPTGAELWYSDKHIPALQEDIKDRAEVISLQAAAARTLVDGDFEPDSVVAFIASGDPSVLAHTGELSVQLQPPGATLPATARTPLLMAGEVRCPSCSKLVARSLGPGSLLECPRCRTQVAA